MHRTLEVASRYNFQMYMLQLPYDLLRVDNHMSQSKLYPWDGMAPVVRGLKLVTVIRT